MSNNAHELSNRLLNALDNNYNVVDMHTVNEIISILEKFNITKELLETTRLGKHVNELRRKTTDPTLARRAKVLVKRWRDLVIPTTASPAHTGSNRSSAERQRRFGGTPITSPALPRQVVSPAVPSPRPPSRPAWGGYESDSQDVILVDDDTPPPAPAPVPTSAPTLTSHKPITPPIKRPPSPEPPNDDKKAKRDKKPKKKRVYSRAGPGTETSAGEGWTNRNGAHGRNGWRARDLANIVAGRNKVKTTKELLEQIQSRGATLPAPSSPAHPDSPDVMLIEPESCPIKVDSPVRNGTKQITSPVPAWTPDEGERTRPDCTCGEDPDDSCPAARPTRLQPAHVRALHHTLLPGINGTSAPPHPHQYAVRTAACRDRPGLFASVVPLYKYSDYADDYCVKNLSRVPLCAHLPWTEWAPAPPDPPPPSDPPPLRPYPVDDPPPLNDQDPDPDGEAEDEADPAEPEETPRPKIEKIEAEMVGVPNLEPSERLKAPLLSPEESTQFDGEVKVTMDVEKKFETEPMEHRTVERTKEGCDGRTLYALCASVNESVPYNYSEVRCAPVVRLSADEEKCAEEVEAALAAASDERDELGRPSRASHFAEWHECARLGDLLALPYVVID